MIEFLLALVLVALLIAGMAVGVLMGRKPLAGSCGGMSALGMEVACDICGGDTAICEEVQAENNNSDFNASKNASDLAYDATRPEENKNK